MSQAAALAEPMLKSPTGEKLVEVARQLYADRRVRDREFGGSGAVFRDHAWDMLLDLFIASEEGRSISACSAAIAACAPQSTGLRCLNEMVARGLVKRTVDPSDGRRSMVEITPIAQLSMTAVLTTTRNSWRAKS